MEGGGKVSVQIVSKQADYTDALSGFSPDPYLSGVQVVSTIAIVQHAESILTRHQASSIEGMQSSGVQACVKRELLDPDMIFSG